MPGVWVVYRCREESASPPSPSVVSGLVNDGEEEEEDEEDDEDAVARVHDATALEGGFKSTRVRRAT